MNRKFRINFRFLPCFITISHLY